jgi:membrane protein DedA with SNARE-associated domain
VQHSSDDKLRKRALLILSAIALILFAFIIIQILEDVLVEGTPLTSSPIISSIISFTRDVKNTVSSWGYGGVFGLMILESSSLPVPSEVILPFAGSLVSAGKLNFYLTLLTATAAAIIGSLIDYYIGLKGIEALSKRRVLGRVIFSETQLRIASSWFTKYGSFMVFIARLIPGLRTLISFPAGAVKMKMPKFLAFTTAGCLIWNAILIYVGYYLGQNWYEVAAFSQYIIIAVVVASVALAVAYLIRRRHQNKAFAKQAAA